MEKKFFISPYNCAAKVLFGASIRAGLFKSSIILAIVKVFPDPVTPSKTWLLSKFFKPFFNWSIAIGWSPAGVKLLVILNFFPPSSFLLKKPLEVFFSTVLKDCNIVINLWVFYQNH